MPKHYIQVIDKYNKTKMKLYSFRFHLVNQADIIAHIESQPNKAGYIARLIREDMERQGIKTNTKTTLAEFAKTVSPTDVVVLIFDDGSRLVTDQEHIASDTRVINGNAIKQETIGHDVKYFVEVRNR